MLKKLILVTILLLAFGIYKFYVITQARRASRMAVCSYLCDDKKGEENIACKKRCMRNKDECHRLCDTRSIKGDDSNAACHQECEKGKP